jgi:radical SAM enzyme (TIGR01210 family)
VGSVFPEQNQTAWITAQRPSRPATLAPFEPHGFFLEEERAASGQVVSSATILLTNKECPWRCLMCDLWKNTTTQTVPPGAIPRQIDHALAQLRSRPEQIKLYNSGSFFDPAAIPPADYPAIARMVAFAGRVVVESHPRLVGEKALRLRDLLSGSLEVAMGLETVHPQVLPRLNKKFELAHFSQAAEFLRRNGIAVRAFVLVKPPFMDEAEGLEWAVKSAVFALSCGATVLSLIPTRPGNGALERLTAAGEFSPPRLATLEKALELALNVRGDGRIFADTWDLEQFSNCSACFEKRRQRIHAMNLSQQIPPAIDCPACGLKTD